MSSCCTRGPGGLQEGSTTIDVETAEGPLTLKTADVAADRAATSWARSTPAISR